VGGLLILAIAYLLADKFVVAKRPVAAVETPAAAAIGMAIVDKSIAVLPFADMSEKRDQEYFADGMAEEILDVLAKIPAHRNQPHVLLPVQGP
jgi:adenylate cyclase